MTGRSRLYFSYAVRSLRRGGQRSVLAIFCVAVGVMAVVALRLAGDMVTLSLTSNVREVNGGDISMQSTSLPLAQQDLQPLDQLKQQGRISDWIGLGVSGTATVRKQGGHSVTVPLYVIDDPSRFPLVGSGTLDQPSNTTYGDRLKTGTLVVSTFVADEGALKPGDTAHVTIAGGEGTDVTVGGIARNQRFAGQIAVGYITRATYNAIVPNTPARYGLIEVTTPTPDQVPALADTLRSDFPAATVITVQDALDQNIQASTDTSRFLQIVGLLALLIGGVGIVNTMQVMLSRRRVEIAMLKTTGYRRRDLYGLFAVEAGMIGLAGGVLGTAVGTGLSAGVRVLVERLFNVPITFHVSAGTIATGVLVGLVTSLIFGLLPIVRAAAVRPVVVLRDMGEGATVGSRAQTVGLYLLLIVLFTALSAGLLDSIGLAIASVVGTLIVILLLAGIFAGIITLIGRIPVPERATPLQWAAAAAITALALLVTTVQRAIGVCLIIVAVAYVASVALPRNRRTAVKLALRSLGRARGRTTATLVALFAGVFTIGLILVLGQNITSKIETGISRATTFNVFAIASAQDASRAKQVTQGLQGVQERRITLDTSTTPVQVNQQPLAQVLPAPTPRPTAPPGAPPTAAPAPSGNPERNEVRLGALNGVEGYDLRGGQLPDTTANRGRVLTAADAGTTNVIVRSDLHNGVLHLEVGDTVTLQQAQTGRPVTVTIVGFYSSIARTSTGLVFRAFYRPIVGDVSLINQLGTDQAQTVIGMKLDPQQSHPALTTLENALPDATIINLADFGAIVDQIVSNLVNLLVALASLALFAGIIIIANAVALAMLERRREIGILKAVGHTSTSVLAQVLVENGTIGAIAGITGMLLVTAATALLGVYVLQTDLSVGGPIVAAVAVGVTLLTTITALLVAWAPTRARPLDVLRYE
ncbi:MAG TPA: FtsX-like permease family protein [Candidatus Dormibacteraeota bacterium]|jgi:predicted lysophospholipase L1 biosynthesis ABC-type transport system permease subunit|nr:FtsX-like permease family protein [Candidatus Dormibacteraeota bacterium]